MSNSESKLSSCYSSDVISSEKSLGSSDGLAPDGQNHDINDFHPPKRTKVFRESVDHRGDAADHTSDSDLENAAKNKNSIPLTGVAIGRRSSLTKSMDGSISLSTGLTSSGNLGGPRRVSFSREGPVVNTFGGSSSSRANLQ